MSDRDAYNYALKICLPVFENYKSQETEMIRLLLKHFLDMSFRIEVAQSDCLYTSDNPFIILGDKYTTTIDGAFIPLTSRMVLEMYTRKNSKPKFGNALGKLDETLIAVVNKKTVLHCDRWVYSNKAFSNTQISEIKNIMQEKGNDI